MIEQSVFGYKKDSKQECDIEIDGVLTEVKTTGVRVPKRDQKNANGKTGEAYNVYLGAKEGISITHVTFEPPIQTDFNTSHFWEKSERLLIIFYEYKSYEVVPASGYAKFPIVDYCYNSFSQEEKINYETTGRLSAITCNRFIMIIRMQKSVTNSWLVLLTFFVQISC